MYEVVLTRLLSVLCWYYLAFVSISMAMFGMTAGALAVQLCPGWFKPSEISSRLAQAAFAMAVSMPLALVIMRSPTGMYTQRLPWPLHRSTQYFRILISEHSWFG
jgi:hypothetical protein